MPADLEIVKQKHQVSRQDRGQITGHRHGGCTVWFTGLSGSGKTSVSFALESFLISNKINVYALDGDNIRSGLNNNLSFSAEDCQENIRRIAEVSKLFGDAGLISLCSFVSKNKKHRQLAREIVEGGQLPFFEIFVDTPSEICEQRDPKGFYKKARDGRMKGFIVQYEKSEHVDYVLDTVDSSVTDSMMQIVNFLVDKGILPSDLRNDFPTLKDEDK